MRRRPLRWIHALNGALAAVLVTTVLAAPTDSGQDREPSGPVFYVDPAAGSNSNDGTGPAHPWKNPPGTRTADGTGFFSQAWGQVTSSNKVPPASTILLRGGRTHHRPGRHGVGMAGQPGPDRDYRGFPLAQKDRVC